MPIFPFKPNWSTATEVTLSFKTDIFTSRSGLEQRRALRTTPRRRVDYSSLTTHSDLTRFTRLMGSQQNATFDFPDWTRRVLSHGIVSGATHFSIRSMAPEWLVAGATVFLIDGETQTLVTVASVDAYTVELTAPVAQDYSAAMVLRPRMTGLLGSMQQRTQTSTVATVEVSYDVTPASVPLSDNTFFANVVDGKEVFAFPWNWGEEVSAQYDWAVENVDFDRGVITTSRPIDFGTVTQTMSIIREGEEIDGLLRFIERQKGQRGMFWLPTGTDDMTVTSDISSGSTTVVVSGTEVATLFAADPVYTGIAIVLKDGRKVYRKINSITSSGGNSNITLSTATTFAIAVSQIAKVCWMRPVRLASDEVTLEYLTATTARWQPRTVTVTYGSDAALEYSALDGAAQWAMDNWGDDTADIATALDYLVNVAAAYGDVAGMAHSDLDDAVNNELWDALG